jgi:hypothetical protein
MEPLESTTILGDVEKLTQVGHLEGNVFVTSSQTLKKFVEDRAEREKFVDSTPYITVTLVSERFGRRVQVPVPPDITAGALALSLVKMLKLPRNHRVEELGFELIFSYTVMFKGTRVGKWTKLSAAGIEDRSEIGLQIDFEWKDPAVPDQQGYSSSSGGGSILFHLPLRGGWPR